jgi:hypothetical protein
MEMGGQHHVVVALLLAKKVRWGPHPVWTNWRTEKFLNAVRTGIPDRPASSPQPRRYTDYDFPAQMKPKAMQISIKEDTQST